MVVEMLEVVVMTEMVVTSLKPRRSSPVYQRGEVGPPWPPWLTWPPDLSTMLCRGASCTW